jgi:hypothetical protein
MQDNRYRTWDAYSNQYWPAEYLIDRTGEVRHVRFGEGYYGESENAIRSLLGLSGTSTASNSLPEGFITPESYLGYSRLDRYTGSRIVKGQVASYTLPKRLPQNELAYGGKWRVEGEKIVAGAGAQLRLHFHARDIYLVLGGRGRVGINIAGKPVAPVTVDAYRLYTLHSSKAISDGLLDLRFTPGIQAYAFTFG